MIWGWFIKKAWPFLLSGGLLLVVVFLSKRNGQLTARIQQAETTVKLQKGMRDAVANTPTDRNSVARRLRDGRF